jgi:predicted ATPase/DNA-binding CsgD family transcriptional regulator/DNA-binding XRE family transcriptional regulator
MDDQDTWGARLRHLRQARALTQAALAQQAGCAPDTVKKIEAGVRCPSLGLATRFADALGLMGAERAAFLAAGTRLRARAAPQSPARPGNLPLPLTSFIGRQRELALAQSLLQAAPSRLLTFSGAGGSGKTRLALQLAGTLQADYPDGVWLVALAEFDDPLLVPEAVAAALAIRSTGRTSITTQLLAYLRSRALLLVLDNCEHLLAACATLADTILRTCPRIRILATSREGLGIGGETVYVVPPLTLPDAPPDPALSADDLRGIEQAESVRLFLDRARAAWPGFALTAQNARPLVRLCRRLDGLPLALELAAAQVRVLGVEEIATSLDHSLHLLSGGSRTAPERHQTLQAALDWSYALLTPAERVLLRRLAVFAGGFTVDAVQAVCGDAEAGTARLFDRLVRLVDQSLVIVSRDQQPTRYRLLEPIRQYARSKLREAEELETVQSRHAGCFLALAEQAAPQLWQAQHTSGLEQLRLEQDNLRAALHWAVEQRAATVGARLVRALYWFWFLCGRVSEGRRAVAGILAVVGPGGPTEERAGLLGIAGYLGFLGGDSTAVARAHLEESAALFRALGNQAGLAHTLNALGLVLLFEVDAATARQVLEESARLFAELGDPSGRASTLLGQTMAALAQADFAGARALTTEALALYERSGNAWGIAISLNYLGDVARGQGDYRRAGELYTQARLLFEQAGVQAESASILHNLGYVALARGELGRAQALFAESLARQRDQGNRAGVLEALAGFGALRAAQGQPRRGAVLAGAVAALRAAGGVPIWPAERIENERHRAKLRKVLGAPALEDALSEGQGLTLEQAIAYAQEGTTPRAAAYSPAAGPVGEGLTAREREVVALIAAGRSNRQIAGALTVTERTVEAHIRNIRAKLDVTSRAQLAVWAVERGLRPGRT